MPIPPAPAAHTVAELEAALGAQIRDLRLRLNRTQAEVARDANVSESSLRALERGKGSTLTTLVSVVRALGADDWLERLAPVAQVSPMERLHAARAARPRHRASRPRAPRSAGGTL